MRRDAGGRALRVPSHVESVVFGDAIVILDLDAQRISVYNTAAALLWNEVATGTSRDGLIGTLTTAFALPRRRAAQDVDRLVAHWTGEGLVAGTCETNQPRRAVTVGQDLCRAAPGGLAWTAAIGQASISISAPADLGDRIRPWLAHLETGRGIATATIAVARSAENDMALFVNGTERFRTPDFALLMGGVCQAIIELSQPATQWLGWMHGAAVAADGRAIALPAPSGSGKSTLVAHLLTRGFRLLTDDVIGLAAPHGAVAPWPMPISLKLGSWDLLAPDLPDLATTPTQGTRGKIERLFMPGPENWCAHPLPLGAICFPLYKADAATRLTRLTPLDALQRLLEDRCHLGFPLCAERVRGFLAVLARVPAFALCYSSLNEARACLDGLPQS